MQFRVADYEEFEKIFSFWEKIFGWDDNRKRILKNYVAAGVRAGTNKIFLMELDGKLVGSVLNVISSVFYDDVILNKASVGEVSICGDFQGKGFGHRLMEENQKFLKREGIDFSRLGGLTKFYSRFGYVSVPTKSYKVFLSSISGGVKKLAVDELLGGSNNRDNSKIRELSLPKELGLWESAHNEFHRSYYFSEYISGQAIEYWKLRSNSSDNIRIFGYFDDSGELCAYIMSWGEMLENVVDMGYRSYESGLELLKFYILSAKKLGASEISFSFADEDVLTSTGLVVRKVESLTQTASTMISIIDLEKFFEKLKGVFAKRLAETIFADFGFEVFISDMGLSVELQGCGAKGEKIVVGLPYKDLVSLVFNYRCANEISNRLDVKAGNKVVAIAILSILFPYTGKLFASFS